MCPMYSVRIRYEYMPTLSCFFPLKQAELRRAAAPAASAAPGDLASLGGEIIAVGCVAWEAEHAHLRWHSGMSAEWR